MRAPLRMMRHLTRKRQPRFIRLRILAIFVPATEVAGFVNDYAEWMRRRLANRQDSIEALFAPPVEATPEVIRKWKQGHPVSPELSRVLRLLAARYVRRATGVPDNRVSWSGRANGGHRYTPETLLALWRDMGYPVPRHDYTMPIPVLVASTGHKVTRTCARERCGNPVTWSNKLYCCEQCRKLAEKQRARARARHESFHR